MSRFGVIVGLIGGLFGGLGWIAAPVPAVGQPAPVHECDVLAAEPGALPGVPGVASGSLDAGAAAAACGQALQDHPGEARFIHQYARALERLGEDAAAARLYQWASGDGYDPAIRALARLSGEAPPEIGPTEAEEPPVPASDRAGLVAARAAAIGSDPADLLAWVASEIGAEAYAGAMRGAAGTLLAGAGSAADKALLLHALIAAADPAAELRFAQCVLPEAEVEALVAAARSSRPPRPEPLLEIAERTVPEIEDPAIRRFAEGLAAIWADATDAVRRQAEEIEAALAANGDTLPIPRVAEAELRRGLAAHVWLQRRQGDLWADLDPTVEGATVGRARCAAASTHEALPDAVFHRLEVRVVVEEKGEGALGSRTLLEEGWRAADVAETDLSFMIAEAIGRGSLAAGREPPPEGFLAYTPLLRVGGAERVGESFFLPEPLSYEGEGDLFGLGRAIGGFLEALDPPAADAEPGAPRPEGNVAALWLDLTVAAPDGTRERVVRPVFDRIGYVARARRDAAVLPLADLAEIDGEYQALAAVWSIALWTGDWGVGPWGDDSAASTDSEDLGGLIAALARSHRTYEGLRHALYAAAGGEDARFALPRPGLSILRWVPAADAVAMADLVMDVLSDPARPLPGAPVDGTAAAAWSVSAPLAERLVVGAGFLVPPLVGAEDVPPFVPVDVPALFDRARAQGIPLAWLGPGDAAAGRIVASAEALGRIEAHLAEGRRLLVPERAVAVGSASLLGWWLVDPAAGTLRDQLETGGHQETTEYTVTTQPARSATPAYRSFFQRIACTIQRFDAVLSIIGALQGDPTVPQSWRETQRIEAAYREAAEDTGRRSGRGAACGGR